MNPYLTKVREPVSWRSRALCVGDPELFFDPTRVAEAVSTCDACPVEAPCALEAHARAEKDGVWGGIARGSVLAAARGEASRLR